MTDKLEELIERVRNGLDKVANCCGCNTYSVEAALDELEAYVKGTDD